MSSQPRRGYRSSNFSTSGFISSTKMHLCEAEVLVPVIREYIVATRTPMVTNESAWPVDRLIDLSLVQCLQRTLRQVKATCA
jgi:aminoglycoside N3'-acetyltransferase